MENKLDELYHIYFILYFFVIIYIIERYLKQKVKKKEFKFGNFIISPKYQEFYYIFKKKDKKYSFKIYGRVLMQLKYVETDKIGSEVQVECLDIKLKEKFFKFLKKGEKMAILTW